MKRNTIKGLVAVAALAAATGAQAQLVVSNLDETPFANLIIGPWGGSDQGDPKAQMFSTPATGLGWTLNSLNLWLAPTGTPPGDLTVQLYSESSGVPGTVLGTLTGVNPTTTGVYPYTPTTTIVLAANTSYFAVLSAPTSAGNYYGWRTTVSTAETGDPGWSIADAALLLLGTDDWRGGSTPGQMSVNAAVVPEPHEYAAMAALGLLGFAGYRRYRNRA